MDLTEGEEIKKRWQEYTEQLYKKDLHNPDNHDGVITHLDPDILECKVKRWGYQTTWSASLEICTQVKKQQLELDMEQWAGSKSGKEYIKAVTLLI